MFTIRLKVQYNSFDYFCELTLNPFINVCNYRRRGVQKLYKS